MTTPYGRRKRFGGFKVKIETSFEWVGGHDDGTGTDSPEMF